MYAFHHDLLSASENELKEFLEVLTKYIPKEENPWKGEQPQFCSLVFNQWQQAHSNVSQLIKEKIDYQHNNRMFFLSFFSVLILAIALGYRVFVSDSKVANLQDQLKAIELRQLSNAEKQPASKLNKDRTLNDPRHSDS